MSDAEQTTRGFEWDFDTIAKGFTAAGVLVYALLFVAYREYYSTLRVSPEEVGVGNAYVLARSTGFVALTLALLGLNYATLRFFTGFDTGPVTRGDALRWLGLALAGIFWSVYLAALLPGDAPGWASVTLPALCLMTIWALAGAALKPGWTRPLLALVGVVTVTVPAVLLVLRARSMANMVREGKAVQPYDVLGIPTLDLATPRVVVTWVGPPGQVPDAVFPRGQVADGVLIGSGPVVAIVGIRGRGGLRLVRLPIAQVVLTASVRMD